MQGIHKLGANMTRCSQGDRVEAQASTQLQILTPNHQIPEQRHPTDVITAFEHEVSPHLQQCSLLHERQAGGRAGPGEVRQMLAAG